MICDDDDGRGHQDPHYDDDFGDDDDGSRQRDLLASRFGDSLAFSSII